MCGFSSESGLPIVKTPVYDYTIVTFPCALLPEAALLIAGSVYMLPSARPRRFFPASPYSTAPAKLIELGGGCAIFRIR